MSEKRSLSVADYFNYILSEGAGWDVWLMEEEGKEYVLMDNFAAPPVEAKAILAIAVDREEAKRIADEEAKKRGVEVRIEDVDMRYEGEDDLYDEEVEI